MPNIKSLALIVFEISTAQYFGGHFETEGGTTWFLMVHICVKFHGCGSNSFCSIAVTKNPEGWKD